MKRFMWLVLSCLMVVSLMLASCGPSAEKQVEEGKTVIGEVVKKDAPVADEEEDEVVESVVVEPTGPEYGGTLTVINPYSIYEPESWDPNDMVWNTSTFAGGTYQTIFWGDINKGPRGTNEWTFPEFDYIPEQYTTGCLVESWEFTDPLNILFHVRKGIYFPDKPGVMASREMTAEDIVFARNRFKFDSGFPEPGPEDWFNSLEVVDKYTFNAKLNFFCAYWVSKLGFRWCSTLVYPPELVEAGFEWQNITGTGPFMLEDYVAGASLTYKRNPVYWEKAVIDGKEYQLPFIDTWQYLLISDTITQLAALRTGKADLMDPVRWEDVESLEKTNPELNRFRYLSDGMWGVALRMDQPPFDNLKVRQAAAMAIDQVAVRDSIYGGEAEIFSFKFKADWPDVLFTPLEEYPDVVQEMYGYHPDKAKQLLAEAGYPDGFKVDILTNALPRHEDFLDLVENFWGAIGIEIEPRVYETSAYLSLMGDRDYDTILTSIGNSNPWMIEDLISPGYTWNTSIFNEPETWAKFQEKVLINPDVAEQNSTLKWLNARFIEMGGVIPFPAQYSNAYSWPWVKNWFGERNLTYCNPAPIYAHIWIDQDMRKDMVGR